MTDTFAQLTAAIRRPTPFQPSDAPFWTDDYIAGQLLTTHLDQSDDAASRTLPELDRCAALLTRMGLTGPGRRVLDLGCGPGLLAERLAAGGALVTGIDVSASSLRHARRSAARHRLTIDYRRHDFRDLDDIAGYDLVVQSYGELGTLDEDALRAVLHAVRRALRPGGALVFDVTTPHAPRPSPAKDWRLLDGGLWRPGPHMLLTQHLEYPDDLRCDHYVVVDEHGATAYRLWIRDYTLDSITRILDCAGFTVERVWSSLGGGAYNDRSPWIAVLARSRGLPTGVSV